MRVSTSLVYSLGVEAIGRAQADLVHTQQQIAAGKRMLTPADDPIASVEVITTEQAQAQTAQYAANVAAAKDSLRQYESSLSQVTDDLQAIRTLAVNAGSGVLNDSDRASIAGELDSRLQQLLGIANAKDGNGRYMFGGFRIGSQPFVADATGASYLGDQGQLLLQVASGRQLPAGENGSAVFESIRTGNGTFVARAAGANAGTGVVSQGQIVNAAALTGDSYAVQFSVAAGVTTYDIVDTTTSTVVSAGNAFTDGATIGVAGMQVQITGAPANGDAFTLAPSGNQSVFTTVRKLIATLATPGGSAAGRTQIANGLNQALQDVDQALDHMLVVRAGIGARLGELDALTSANEDRSLQYDQTLSALRDLDYNKALSDFARQQLALEAAQKSFAKMSALSLFSQM
jgi:flagellar hook-associated protein 3 FlgL